MNEVVIYDESVSRHHAEIIFENDEFYLRDIGSTTGTYIKIVEKIDLEEGMIIEIGSYQFLIGDIFINNQMMGDKNMISAKPYVALEIYDGPEECERTKYMLEEGGSIGRKTNNKIHFTDDLHMSNLHCKITRIGNKFVLEDMASTNG
jgi:pSer/pThr/pTyr-binding forkhead associated (FHA) protein